MFERTISNLRSFIAIIIKGGTPSPQNRCIWTRPRLLSPLQRHRALSIATCVVLFIAFLLFLIVALSLPIIKTVYLLILYAGIQPNEPVIPVTTQVRFGVWGLCVNSVSTEPLLFPNNEKCYGPMLGYTLDNQTLVGTGYPALATVIMKSLTTVLVLHPVVAGLSLVGAVSSLWIASHAVLIFSLVVTVINTVLSCVVFGIDLAISIVARNEASSLSQFDISINWGNGVWMILAAVILTWAGMILLSIPVCGCCGVREKYLAWESHQVEKARS